MTDKLRLVPKMNSSASSGHHGDSQHGGGSRESKTRTNDRGRGKNVPVRNREKNYNPGPAEEGEQPTRGGFRNTKKGRVANDLLDFQTYQPRPAPYNHRSTRKPAAVYKKEDYVTVSCQFVVKEGDWEGLTAIDSSVSWEDVVQVRLPCEELATCPICLYPPVCPVSPPCGHAMCYSCALRFNDNCPAGDCPICHKPLIISDFRPLMTYTRTSYKAGDEIDFVLVNRARHGRITYPVGDDATCFSNVPNLSNTGGVQFNNVVTASDPQILQEVLMVQEDQLKTQLAIMEDEDKEAEPYILKALSEVNDRKDKCFDNIEVQLKSKKPSAEESPKRQRSGGNLYFYQTADGQPIFIHPLNSRCLIHEYGSIEQCPPEVNCKIIAMEHYTQSPDLRSRFRYFSHLPLGCSFILCEVDVSPFISPETFDHFKCELDKRADARRSKEQKENAYTNRLSRKLAEKEVTYHCSAYLPQYTEISKPAAEHFKTQDSYDLLADAAPLSFADKLRAGAAKSTPWVNPHLADRYRINSTSSDISVDGADAAAPSYQHSFSASLNDAFASLEVTHTTQVNRTAPRGGKKKKNKGKTISLTGGARRC